MSTEARRLPSGGRIDRSRTLRFLFNGRRYEGHPGDTLASALLANNVSIVSRSLKFHRPRGIMTAGPEEPNALLQVGVGPRTTPNLKAPEVELHDGLIATSVNNWPSVQFDLGAATDFLGRMLAAGFYYKTFMPSQVLWDRLFEPAIRRAAGWGKAPEEGDRDRYDGQYAHCDLLVIGGGPAGLATALAAGRSGARVILVEDQNELGGSLLFLPRKIDGMEAAEWVREVSAELDSLPEVRVLPRTTAIGHFDQNFVVAVERRTDHLGPQIGSIKPRQCIWRIRAKRVVHATGAIERPLVFGGNDRPGVMLAGAALSYVRRYAVMPGRRAVVFTNNDSAYESALALADAGVRVEALIDVRAEGGAALTEAVRERGIEIVPNAVVVGTAGWRRVRSVRVMSRERGGDGVTGTARVIKCDLVAVSGGWTSNVTLWSQAQGTLRWDDRLACPVPSVPAQKVEAVGACAGEVGLADALAAGLRAGRDAAQECGRQATEIPLPAVDEPVMAPPQALWLVPSLKKPAWGPQKAFVDFQNDTTAADLLLALREGFESIEHVKRYTLTGFGTDQGKIVNVNAAGIVAEHLGLSPAEVGLPTFRPPVVPVGFGALAGRHVGRFVEPVRLTPMHDWHEAAGAVFTENARWLRPRCYPLSGETEAEAVERECLAVRERVGLHDSSTLGKINMQGPDVATFLERAFINLWSDLEPGAIRYGLMLRDSGGILSDAVCARLDERRWVMTTNTASADAVLDHLEHLLQTRWRDLTVWLTPVTERWATATLAGPRARDVLAKVCPELPVGTRSVPFMSVRETTVAGVPGRVARIGYTGELAYELSVPWSRGMMLWQALLEAGAPYGIAPVGLGALDVLRTEKGFVTIGQDTDSGTTPEDLGYGRLIARSKPNFVGKEGLALPAAQAPDRLQLVGLLTEDPLIVLPEGAPLAARREVEPPEAILGHVTSAHYSPALKRSIALALLRGGHKKEGQTVHAQLGDKTVAATVTQPVFYDREGRRRDA